MSETPEHPTEPTSAVATAPAPPPYVAAPVARDDRPNRLFRVAAWVAIVAGIVFIISVIFFSGFALGRHAGGYGHGHYGGGGGHHGEFQRGGPPMMGPFGPMGPWQFGGGGAGGAPGQPGQPGQGGAGGAGGAPGQLSPSTPPRP